MSKIFRCNNCGEEYKKWAGICNKCNTRNSFVETEKVLKVKNKFDSLDLDPQKTTRAKSLGSDFFKEDKVRLTTGLSEVDRVFGKGGIMTGSAVLFTGSPGVGKSTLSLQIAKGIAKSKKVLIVSAEESENQIFSRAKRLSIKSENIKILSTSSVENAIYNIEKEKSDFVIIDSIQTISFETEKNFDVGGNRAKRILEILLDFTKKRGITTIFIGHITKDGNIAGPKYIEHLVDTVIYFSGEKEQNLKILKSLKNRFGSTDEVGILEMTEKGLLDIKNPSMEFLSTYENDIFGSVNTATISGSRAILLEMQSLTTRTNFGYPKRTTIGVSLNKLNIIIAVLTKYTSIKVENDDVYMNIIGGFNIEESACDLAIASAIASSKKRIAIDKKVAIFGEIGLLGELRSVSNEKKRLKEIEKFGFEKVYCPKLQKKPKNINLEIKEFSDINSFILELGK